MLRAEKSSIGVIGMGGTKMYAQVIENVLAVKSGVAPVAMRGKVFPVLSEDENTGCITVLASGRKITMERRLVTLLTESEADVYLRQVVSV